LAKVEKVHHSDIPDNYGLFEINCKNMFKKKLTLTGKYLFSCRIYNVHPSWLNGRNEIADEI